MQLFYAYKNALGDKVTTTIYYALDSLNPNH